MRAREFVTETASAGASSSGNIAAIAQPVGSVISRTQHTKPAKYRNSAKSIKLK
jgi:hypothetical protein